jgi:uncharacterized membrane protein
MSPPLRRATRWFAILAGVFGYPVLAHLSAATSAATTAPGFGVAIAIAPPLALLIWLAWRSGRRQGWLAFLAGIAGLLLLWAFWGELKRDLPWVYLAQHAGTNALLAALFGLSLSRGRQPLCTRIAETVRGSLAPEVARYTRHVTVAWTLFFLGMALVSTSLFLLAPIGTWSIFANFLWFPLILLMFIAEYLVRRRRLPHLEHYGIRAGILAFRRMPRLSTDSSPPTP